MEKEHQRDLTRKTRASYYGKVKVETTEMLYKKSWWFWTVPVWLEKNVRGQDMAYCKPIETVFFILGIALRSIQIPTWTSRALRGKKITFAVNRCYHFLILSPWSSTPLILHFNFTQFNYSSPSEAHRFLILQLNSLLHLFLLPFLCPHVRFPDPRLIIYPVSSSESQ